MKTIRCTFVVFLALFNVSAQASPPECTASLIGKAVDVSRGIPIKKSQIQAIIRRYLPDYEAHFDVRARTVVYCTEDALHQPAAASGLWVTPTGTTIKEAELASRNFVSYQHGTKTDRMDSTTNLLQTESMLLVSVAAAQGATVVAADYLGLSPYFTHVPSTFHPYLHEETSAGAVIDLIHAVETAQGKEAVSLFLTGYSQGGYVTLAAAQAMIRQGGEWERKLRAVSPLAGPYDLGGKTFEDALARPAPRMTNLFFAYAFLGYNQIYGLTDSLDEVFLPSYAQKIEKLFNYRKSVNQVSEGLPDLPQELFRPGFLAGLTGETRDLPDSERRSAQIGAETRRILHLNSPLESSFGTGMRSVPIRFGHCPDDEFVSPASTTVAVAAMKAQGFTAVESLALPAPHAPTPGTDESYHALAASRALLDAFTWFGTMMR